MEESTLRQRARDLRKNSTDAERHLWYHLRMGMSGYLKTIYIILAFLTYEKGFEAVYLTSAILLTEVLEKKIFEAARVNYA